MNRKKSDISFDYWAYILAIKEKYTDQQFQEALENLQPPCSLDKYSVLSYFECIALEDGIGELLELVYDEKDFNRAINNLIKKLLMYKKNSELDETKQIKYLLHLINEMIESPKIYQQDSIQYDICQVDSVVLYIEIISELYAIDFWRLYEYVPHERIVF